MHTALLLALLAFGHPTHVPLSPHLCGVIDRPDASAATATAICPHPAFDAPVIVDARLYVAVPAASVETREAQATATRILAAAGIPLRWTVCDRAGAIVEPGPCDVPPADRELIVRIARSRAGEGGQALGFAYVPGVVATAFADRVADAADRTHLRAGTLLGGVIAHEIAHLLFGPAHTREGLMRATWTDAWLVGDRTSRFRIDLPRR